MEIISLRIRTADEEYGRVLQTVLKRNYPGFLITMEMLGESEEKEGSGNPAGATGGWGIDLSLCDDRAALEEAEVLLVDLPAQENVTAAGELSDETVRIAGQPACLFKYAPAREMIAKILGLCSAGMHRQIFLPRAERCRIIGVFSGAGGKGCTAVSLALAQLGARLRGSRPLLVPLSQLPRGGACAATAGVMPLREYVCRTLKKEEAAPASSLLASACVKDAFGTGRFSIPSGENPLYHLSGGGMQKVLMDITDGSFDTVIIDIGTACNEAAFASLRAADRLLMLCGNQEDDKVLLDLLRQRCGGGVLEKIIKVKNRWEQKEPTPIEQFYEEPEKNAEEAVIDFYIPYEPRLDHERGAAFDPVFPLEGGFTDAVEDLLTGLSVA